ncbi:helix-turn-helix transcriptional regulator [Cellulomonas sp. IC4_254]|uniref:helix-turn-helix domain-containing protein n=1 Tax=Cellulomonas sp. IC4_254 TaxID=2714040 RepID=UPI0014235E29|nr:helix-turn-helix transcriptional regulator [Cellulomonas sp. IC4_254]NHT17496.1 helix-turn-helix domain-containing protein [Cellulomonas sp. IC4_254]
MTTIADRVRQARLAAGLSQTALAGDALSPSYISLIESGRREPTDAALGVIAERLGSTVEYLKHGDEGPAEARAKLALDYARLDLVSGEASSARDRILALDLEPVTRQVRVEALLALAQAHEMLGDLESAVGVLEPLLTQARVEQHHLDAAAAATALVASYVESGDLGRAIEVGDRQLAELEEAGLTGTDEHLRLGSTTLWAYVERGDLLYATHRAAELIRQAESLGTPRGRGSVYWNAALVAEQRHDYGLAKRYTERALALLGEGEVSRDIPRLRLNYAWLLLRSDPAEPATALEQLDRAAPELQVSGSEVEMARLDVERSRAHLMQGDPVAAEMYGRAALDRLGDQPRLDGAAAQLAIGDALHARGEVEAASRAYRWAADMLGMMSASRQSAAVWRELGDRFLGHGDVTGAAQAFDRALREAGFRPAVPAVLWEAWSAVAQTQD